MGEIKVYRGKKDHKDVGRVISFNGETGKFQHFWINYNNRLLQIVFFIDIESSAFEDDECKKFRGTDTTIFPSFLAKEDGLLQLKC